MLIPLAASPPIQESVLPFYWTLASPASYAYPRFLAKSKRDPEGDQACRNGDTSHYAFDMACTRNG